MIGLELLILALVAALWAPDALIGKTLRHVLIDAPANAYRRATPLRAAVGFIVFFGLIAFVLAAPEWTALFGIGDLAAYLDVGVILLLTSVVGRLKSLLVRVVLFAHHFTARVGARMQRRIRSSRPRKPRTPPTTDDDGADWGWAFA